MQIQKLASSTIIISTEDCKILCDPWLENGEYFGSWSLVEKIHKKNFYEYIDLCEFIYISHIHPDHFSKKTLEKISKKKKIVIHSYASPFLKRNLNFLGFNNVIELKHNEKKYIKGKTSITIYAADNCDPNICKKFVGCNYSTEDKGKKTHQVDTCALISDDKNNCLNLNDCEYKMMTSTIKKIKEEYEKINILLVNYNSAHSYPQNIKNFSEKEKIKISEKIKKLTLQKSVSYINKFNPDYFIPFAGEYTISGKYYFLNKFKGVNSQEECFSFFKNSKFYQKLIMLNYGEKFDSHDGKFEFKQKTNKEYLDYEKNNLTKIKYDYEYDDEPDKKMIEELAQKAFDRLKSKIDYLSLNLDHVLLIKYYEKFIKLDLKSKNITFEKKNETTHDIKEYTIVELDEKLLTRLLKGPKHAHWNNADIGSHIFYTRSDINNYNYKIWNSIAYFHA